MSLRHVFGLAIFQILGAAVFAGLYWLMVTRRPGKHFIGLDKGSSPLDYLYYSITTQSTVGYGDIHPISPLARGLAIVQMILIGTGAGLAIHILVSRL